MDHLTGPSSSLPPHETGADPARPGPDVPADATARPALRARGVDDLLGYAGHVLGALRPGSLVLVALHGTALGAVVRVDPPSVATGGGDDAERWAEAVADVLARDRAADAAVALEIAHDRPRLPGRAPVPDWHAPLARAVADRGRPLREGWTVRGGLAHPWPGEGTSHEEDGPRRDVAVAVDPGASELSLHLIGRGSVWGLRADHTRVPAHRPPGPAEAQEWARHTPDPGPADPAALEEWLADWERALRPGAVPPGAEVATDARRAGPLTRAAWRDALLLRAASRPGAVPTDPARRAAVLTGRAAQAPDWRRLDALWSRLRELAVRAPAGHAAQALTLASWIAWARGEGSAAGAHLEAAAALAVPDGLGRVLDRLVGAGVVCDWAADPRRCWRP